MTPADHWKLRLLAAITLIALTTMPMCGRATSLPPEPGFAVTETRTQDAEAARLFLDMTSNASEVQR